MDQQNPQQANACGHAHGGVGGGCGCGGHKMCPCPHHKMMPLFISLIGLTFLAKALGWLGATTADIVWPLLLVLMGLQKMFGHLCGCCKKA